MATWKKANEAYFGDTFNRDSAVCSYAITDNDLKSITGTVDLAYDGLSNTAYGLASASSGDLYCSGTIKANDYAIELVTNSLTTELKKIQMDIDELKKSMVPKKENSELRSALKTLHYKREVE